VNRQTRDATRQFIRLMTDACIIINVMLMCLSVTLSDWNLFKLAALSGSLLVCNRLYRYHEQKEEDKKQ
jgi:uncharacterized membrane protein